MIPPRELCDDHDVPIDEYGCWVCGHAGPITEPAKDSGLVPPVVRRTDPRNDLAAPIASRTYACVSSVSRIRETRPIGPARRFSETGGSLKLPPKV